MVSEEIFDDFTCPSLWYLAFSVLGIPTGVTQHTRDSGTGVPKTRAGATSFFVSHRPGI